MRPESNGSSPARQRRSVDFPQPEGPWIATTAPGRISASRPRRTARPPNALLRSWMRIMGKAPFEAEREASEGKTHGEIERRAGQTRRDPVVQVDRGDGHALGQLDH